MRDTAAQTQARQVRQSRTDNRNLTIAQRWQAANAWGTDVFVSVHTNAFIQNTAHGTEVFIFDNGVGFGFTWDDTPAE